LLAVASDLLFNLLVILITMIVHQFWIESKPNSKPIIKYSILVTSGLAIFICMVFSFYEYDGVRYDLRRIPLWFGTIYGGPIVGFVLLVLTSVIRFMQGGSDVYSSIMNTALMFFSTVIITPLYFRLGTYKKIILSTFMNIFFSFLVLIAFNFLHHDSFKIDYWFEFLIINAIGIILVSLSVEMIQSNYEWRMKVIYADKLDVVGHLAAAVNHEINNPLTTIRGLIQLVKEDPGLTVEKEQTFLQLALEEVDKVNQIIKDYLTYARPYPTTNEVFQLEEVLHNSINIVRPLAEMEDASIEMGDTPACSLMGDPRQLVQALVNLLKNSINAVKKGGNIELKVRVKNKECFIYIIDNGIGMDKELQKRLGEPYFTTTSTGTGLGLMVVYRIIDSMEGEIKIDSRQGVGTKVVLKLPVL